MTTTCTCEHCPACDLAQREKKLEQRWGIYVGHPTHCRCDRCLRRAADRQERARRERKWQT